MARNRLESSRWAISFFLLRENENTSLLWGRNMVSMIKTALLSVTNIPYLKRSDATAVQRESRDGRHRDKEPKAPSESIASSVINKLQQPVCSFNDPEIISLAVSERP